MKRVIAVICILAVIVVFIGVHVYIVNDLTSDIESLITQTWEKFDERDWDGTLEKLDALQGRWQKSRFWITMTLETEQLEQTEISLRQSTEYAKVQSAEDFSGEFSMYELLITHLANQENGRFEELI